jgi:hypothetical protein
MPPQLCQGQARCPHRTQSHSLPPTTPQQTQPDGNTPDAMQCGGWNQGQRPGNQRAQNGSKPYGCTNRDGGLFLNGEKVKRDPFRRQSVLNGLGTGRVLASHDLMAKQRSPVRHCKESDVNKIARASATVPARSSHQGTKLHLQ